MDLVVLGAAGGWAGPGGAASGYLVRHDGFNLWVDAGTGTLANLQEHIGVLDVGAIVVSHRHFDHFLDLYPYFLARWFRDPRPPKVPLFAPPGMFEHALQLEGDLAGVFDLHVVEPGDTFHPGPFAVRTALMAHPVPTLGMRIEADGTALAYTADTGPSEPLVELARGADLLLSEASWLERPPGAPLALHLTAREAGGQAARAGVGGLVLTHLLPTTDRNASLHEADQGFGGGPVTAPAEGTTIEP